MKHFLNVCKKVCLLLFVSFCLAISSFAQDSKGKDFWLMFPANYQISSAEVTLFISGDVNTSGTVTIPGIGFSQPFTVTVGNVTSVSLPSDVQCDFSSTILNNGVHVTANDEVTVYGLNRELASTDAFLGLPTDILGTEYINLGYYNSNIVNGTQFGLIATQNGTTVTITPSVSTDGHDAGVPYNVVLDQGQTYLLRNTDAAPNDLSGSIVTSDKPIGMFGGHRCANIPGGYTYCDYIVEELPPTSAWGKNFVTVPLKTRTAGDTFRMLASTDNTDVNVNGSVVATLNRGQYFETILTTASQITSSKPILVAQYSNSTSWDGVTSDPFEMLIPPYEQFLGSYTITTPASGFSGNYVNVVAPNGAVGNIQLDGVAIPAGSFSPIGSSGFSGAQVTVSLGVHTFNGSTLPFGVFVYGFDVADSYGYPGGESLAPVAEVTTVSLSPETGTGAVGTNQCFTAAVRDQFSAPLVGVRVDFTVIGANPSSGFDNTGGAGNAQFCYTGTNAGVDTVIASVGTLSDTSYFTWTKRGNNAPEFVYPPTPADGTEYDVTAGQVVSFTVKADDADAGDNVTLSATGVPAGASSSPSLPANGNPVSTNFSWTPGSGDVGTYTIQYKADDGNGGTATTNVIISVSSTCSCDSSFQTHIGVIPKYTVPGQDPHTIYTGYGPQAVALLVAHHGGTAPYKYQWNDGNTNHLRVVSPDVTTTYSVTVTDARGCKSVSTVTIYVVDVRCTTTQGNIFVCNNGQTMSVPKADVSGWLSQGAKLGQCGVSKTTPKPVITARTAGSLTAIASSSFTVFPNPARTDVSFAWSAPAGSHATVVITDLQGRVLMTQALSASPQRISVSSLANGIYMAKLVTPNGTIATSRFVVNK